MADSHAMTEAPVRQNLVRSQRTTGSMALRAQGASSRTLFGHFSVFNQWYEVRSAYEGRFIECVAPGAFNTAFTDPEARDRIRVMFEHGHDPTVAMKPLGTITALREDKIGAYYEVDLFDAPYVNDLIPAMGSNQMGASFRFAIPDGGDVWVDNPGRSAYNPEGLPERTVIGTELFEFGPVVWGASPTASSAVRSGTDEYIEHFLRDPVFVARFTERAGLATTERILATLPPPAPVADPPTDSTEERQDGTTTESADGDEDDSQQRRRAYFEARTAGFVAHLSRL